MEKPLSNQALARTHLRVPKIRLLVDRLTLEAHMVVLEGLWVIC